jgi:hypothetical protein
MPRTRRTTVKIRTYEPAPRKKKPSRAASLVAGGAGGEAHVAPPGPGDHAHGHLEHAGFGHKALPGTGNQFIPGGGHHGAALPHVGDHGGGPHGRRR